MVQHHGRHRRVVVEGAVMRRQPYGKALVDPIAQKVSTFVDADIRLRLAEVVLESPQLCPTAREGQPIPMSGRLPGNRLLRRGK